MEDFAYPFTVHLYQHGTGGVSLFYFFMGRVKNNISTVLLDVHVNIERGISF